MITAKAEFLLISRRVPWDTVIWVKSLMEVWEQAAWTGGLWLLLKMIFGVDGLSGEKSTTKMRMFLEV